MTVLKCINRIRLVWLLSLLLCPLASMALEFSLPKDGSAVVGEIQTAAVQPGDNFSIIARRYDMGYTELEEANPDVNPDAPKPGTILIIPSQFILPNTPREGLVINLSEMRLYYFPKGKQEVITYPVGIGREGEETPQGVLKVIDHQKKPTWYVPESIRKLRAAQGVELPKMVPPGPDNPLGGYAMRLSNYTYLIHGTNDPLGGIGRRSSSGCIRLYPEDIEKLYSVVSNGTNVYIVDQPYKAGWADNSLYFESHVALQETKDKSNNAVVAAINNAIKNHQANVNWDKALEIAKEVQGLPQIIGHVDINNQSTPPPTAVAAQRNNHEIG